MGLSKKEMIVGLRQVERWAAGIADSLQTGKDGKRINDVSPPLMVLTMQIMLDMLTDPETTKFLQSGWLEPNK